jgi:tetratricopeptide (TPR) repeat protein
MGSCVDSPKYRAFLSYSHRDAKWANWLHRSLEAYRLPRQLVGKITARGPVPKRLAPVFRDREELATATDLGTVINEALAQSACQIIVCSPRSARSRWVNEEILAFKRLGREDRIFCLIVDGEPNAADLPGREDEECFPLALRFKLGADGQPSSERSEPIAADMRPGKDGRQNAKLKLIAGLTGVPFDSLRRREQIRRTRRLVAISTAAMIGMVVTSGLAAYAHIEQRAAEHQRARAEAEAETARQTTTFLVDVFRISDPSEARGNTVTAREMLDKGAARIDKELTNQPEIRATLMDTLGTVYTGLGLYREARPLLEAAVATRRRGGSEDAFSTSVSLEHMGDLLQRQADFAAAEKDYRDAIAIQSVASNDAHRENELANSLYGLGIVLEQKGAYADAERSLRQALALQRSIYRDTTGDMARTYKDIARTMDKEGDLKGAIPVMRSALQLQRKLHGTEPHPDVAEAINDLALLLEEHGDYDESGTLFREAIAQYRRLLGDKHPYVAVALGNVALTQSEKGDAAGAEVTYREALAMQRALLGDVHPDVAVTLNNLAFVQSDRGDLRGAIATEDQALAIYQKLFPGDNPDVARIMNRIGFWQIEIGDDAAAGRTLETALAMRRRLLGPSHPDVGTSLVHMAILQVARHHYDAALASANEAIAILSPALSATNWKTAVAESAQGAAIEGLGRLAEAQTHLTHSVGILAKDEGAPSEYRRLAAGYWDHLRARLAGGARMDRVAATAATPAVVNKP